VSVPGVPAETVLLVAGLAVFVAALVQGVTGFAFALVSTPLLMTVYQPRASLVLVVGLSSLASAFLAWRLRAQVDRRLLLPLAGASVAGSVLGVLVLARAEGHAWFKLAVAAFAALAALVILSGFRKPIRRERLAGVAAGLLSGFLATTTSLSGPPVVVLLSNQGHTRDRFRGTIAAFFALTGLWAVPLLALGGGSPAQVALHMVYLLPALILGNLAGSLLAPRVQEGPFRVVVGLIVLVSSLRLALGALP